MSEQRFDWQEYQARLADKDKRRKRRAFKPRKHFKGKRS